MERSSCPVAPTPPAGGRHRGHGHRHSRADAAPAGRFALDGERGDCVDDEHDGLTEHRTPGTCARVHADGGTFVAFVEAP